MVPHTMLRFAEAVIVQPFAELRWCPPIISEAPGGSRHPTNPSVVEYHIPFQSILLYQNLESLAGIHSTYYSVYQYVVNVYARFVT